MKVKRMLATVLSLILLLSICPVAAWAAPDKQWYENDYWELEQLLSLGAALPVYNAAAGQYEISTPEQLLFLSGLWKPEDSDGDGAPDAPNNGFYVLTADLDMAPLMARIGGAISAAAGESRVGYMPPIGSETDQTGKDPLDTKCAFFGTFDGQGHAIRNLRVERMGDKYAGFFGNIGHDYGEGYVRNLAVLDMSLKSVASCGLLAGAIYGDVDNCVVTGTIECDEKTVGGLAGKIKKNENGYIGIARNCFAYAEIVIHGLGSENGACGGITSAQSDGGAIENCFAAGSITVEGSKAESVGGVSGNLNGGQTVTGNVMALKSILVESGTDVGLLAGNYSGANGSGVSNNYVWNGTALTGNISSEHPDEAAFVAVTADDLLSQSFYATTVGWEFDQVWAWAGEATRGVPIPRPFGEIGAELVDLLAADLVVKDVILRPSEPMTNAGYEGEPIPLVATLTLPEALAGQAAAVTLHYGGEKNGGSFTKSAPMRDGGDGIYSVDFPENAAGDWYYYFSAAVGDLEITCPSDTGVALRLSIQPRSARKTPQYITVNPGETFDRIGLAWITQDGGLSAKVLWRASGGENWTEVAASDIRDVALGARGNYVSYEAELEGLAASTVYEY
ncbi:MAG: hypothetical protein LBK98_05195, partial [Peptococcaceae bacterium]|nr:hypothetical protein [Peptococcaceae bacterium]